MTESKKKSGDDDWNFKVSDEHLEQVQVKRKPQKASGGAGSIPPREIKKTKKTNVLEVDQVKRKAISRTAVAKRDAALEKYAKLTPPTFANRIIATVIDYGVLGGLGFLGFYLKPVLHYHYIKFLAEKGINQTLDPQLLDNCLIGAFVFIGFFLLLFLPTLSFGRTPGKSIMKITIGSKEMGEEPGTLTILLREFIVKPISMISVIGLLMGVKSSPCLHDLILGTALNIDE
ncbi:MAG: RDD family protein [Bacteriovoracaceae bacterium]|nr:RDD family protein [Bacteriovoracaceae bacterium]